MQSQETIAAHYDKQARSFGRDIKSCHYRSTWSFAQRQRRVLRDLDGVKAQKILDVGCGPGLFSAPLSATNRVVGLDLSFEMLRLARTSLEPVLGCARRLPFRTTSFDVVMAIETLQHISDPMPLIQELSRVTKPAGQLILSALNRSSLLHRILARVGGHALTHFHDLGEIDRMVREAGFITPEVNFLGFPLPLIWRARPDCSESPGATSWILRAWKQIDA